MTGSFILIDFVFSVRSCSISPISRTPPSQKKEDNLSCLQILRRVLDSNQWIPYDIGSLANCWFKPLTQLSVVLNS